MRVLIVTLEVFGGPKKGGGERYATELTRALRRLGHEVMVAVVRSMTALYEQSSSSEDPTPITFRRFATMVRTSDIVHIHQLNTPGFDYASLLARVYGKPLVLTDHGGGALTPGRAFGDARLRLVDAAGFVSAWSRRDVDPSEKIAKYDIIYGGGDHLPTSKPYPERFDFGFIGRLVPHKGAHIVIEALPDDASLVVAGQSRDPAYYQAIRRLAQGKSITFIEDATDHVVASLYHSLGHLVVPSVESYGDHLYSRPELLGLVALEALAAGTPVLGSNVGGLGELLRSAGQTVLPPGRVETWRLALSEARSDPCLVVATDFTWEAVARKCLALYDAASARRSK